MTPEQFERSKQEVIARLDDVHERKLRLLPRVMEILRMFADEGREEAAMLCAEYARLVVDDRIADIEGHEWLAEMRNAGFGP